MTIRRKVIPLRSAVMATGIGIEIRTARLVVRPVRDSDDERLFHLFGNWELIRWLSSPPWPYTRADMQSFVSRAGEADARGSRIAVRNHARG